MRISRSVAFLGIPLFFGAALTVSPAQTHAAVVQITPTSMGDWSFVNADGNATVGNNPTASGSMVSGPATPPYGTGSANLATGNGTSGGDGASILANSGFAGTALSAITSLSYWTYDTQNNTQQFPYLSIEVATGLTGVGQPAYDKVFFEPPYQTPSTGGATLPDQGATVMNSWQQWNALTGGWWDNDGLCGSPGTGVTTLETCIDAMNDPAIVNFDGSPDALAGVGGIQFTVGFADPTDEFNGNIDGFTIGTNGDTPTTFDFDPAATSAVPEPASLAIFGMGLAGLALLRRRRA